MKFQDVPQDNNRSYGGIRKGLYATDDAGDYHLIASNGWEPEDTVLQQALTQLQQQADAAKRRVLEGKSAILEYYMYQQRMDIALLAKSTGQFQWQVRRHFKPAVFARLNARKINNYSDALGVSVEDLQAGTLPS